MCLHAFALNYTQMRVNTRSVDFTRVQLHALPTQCPRTAHALPANTTRRLHAFYARVGAAIPLTGTVVFLESMKPYLVRVFSYSMEKNTCTTLSQ